VNRSLAAANAIRAGNSMRRAISRIMDSQSPYCYPGDHAIRDYGRDMNNRETSCR
jgi:hypothetical protein